MVDGYWCARERVTTGAPGGRRSMGDTTAGVAVAVKRSLAREGWKGDTIVGVVGEVEFHRL